MNPGGVNPAGRQGKTQAPGQWDQAVDGEADKLDREGKFKTGKGDRSVKKNKGEKKRRKAKGGIQRRNRESARTMQQLKKAAKKKLTKSREQETGKVSTKAKNKQVKKLKTAGYKKKEAREIINKIVAEIEKEGPALIEKAVTNVTEETQAEEVSPEVLELREAEEAAETEKREAAIDSAKRALRKGLVQSDEVSESLKIALAKKLSQFHKGPGISEEAAKARALTQVKAMIVDIKETLAQEEIQPIHDAVAAILRSKDIKNMDTLIPSLTNLAKANGSVGEYALALGVDRSIAKELQGMIDRVVKTNEGSMEDLINVINETNGTLKKIGLKNPKMYKLLAGFIKFFEFVGNKFIAYTEGILPWDKLTDGKTEAQQAKIKRMVGVAIIVILAAVVAVSIAGAVSAAPGIAAVSAVMVPLILEFVREYVSNNLGESETPVVVNISGSGLSPENVEALAEAGAEVYVE